jgi:hypothetical protein
MMPKSRWLDSKTDTNAPNVTDSSSMMYNKLENSTKTIPLYA